jgi:elongation factor G
VIGFSDTVTGDHPLCPDNPIVLEAIEFPAPVLSVAMSVEKRQDRDRLTAALSKLSEEDPTFVVETHEETGETVVSGMGELHLEIITDRLRREFNVQTRTSTPRVAYRETITGGTDWNERFVKQTGGKGQYAHIIFRLDPLPAGGGFEFENRVTGGNIPREYIPSIERGVIDAMKRGVYADCPVVDVKFTLLDGTFHPVDSSEMAFRTCSSMGFSKAFLRCAPQLLEPVMGVAVNTPEEYAGPVSGGIYERRGTITGMDSRGTSKEILAMVPLSEMFGYATDLRNVSQGRASFTMQFEHYEPVPVSVAEEIVAEARRRADRASAPTRAQRPGEPRPFSCTPEKPFPGHSGLSSTLLLAGLSGKCAAQIRKSPIPSNPYRMRLSTASVQYPRFHLDGVIQ